MACGQVHYVLMMPLTEVSSYLRYAFAVLVVDIFQKNTQKIWKKNRWALAAL